MLSLFTLGDFIVLLVVAGALIAYRQMDKNNRSIQVVKRYIEHSARRFEEYVEEHIAELREMDGYLKTKEQQARDLMVEMDAILQDMEGHTDDVFLLKEAMEKYDQVLIDLSNATQQVDNNIERIVVMRDEIVTETKRTFHEISNTVLALEARVEGVKGSSDKQTYVQDETETMFTQAKTTSKSSHVVPAVTVAHPKSSLVETPLTSTDNQVEKSKGSIEIEIPKRKETIAPKQTAPLEFVLPGGREVEKKERVETSRVEVEKPAASTDTVVASREPRAQDRITPSQPQRSGEDTRSQIIRLRKQGLGVGEIARTLTIPAGEVELVLGLLDEQHMGFASAPDFASLGKSI